MEDKIFQIKLFDLFYITDLKRVKADELGLNIDRDKLIRTTNYLEDVIKDELHIEWNDDERNSREFINRDFSNYLDIYIY